jgi:hypothetical protein
MAHLVTEDGITFIRNDWYVDDVQARLEDNWDFTLTDDECIKVLQLVADAHDANDGINWDAIDAAIESLYGDRGGQI